LASYLGQIRPTSRAAARYDSSAERPRAAGIFSIEGCRSIR
jgi:hypothetical protein